MYALGKFCNKVVELSNSSKKCKYFAFHVKICKKIVEFVKFFWTKSPKLKKKCKFYTQEKLCKKL